MNSSGVEPAGLSTGLRLEKLLSGVFITLAVLYIFSRFIPAVPVQEYADGDSLDNSWALALHEGFAERWQFGTDLVFTYGPWGFLAGGYLPRTHTVAVVMWSAFSLVYMFVGWRWVRAAGGSQISNWAWLAFVAALTTTPLGNDIDTRLVLFVTLPLLLHFFTDKTGWEKTFLAVILGCLSLVKFTGMVEAAFVVGLISVDEVLRLRRFPRMFFVWLASLVCFWTLAGQRLGNFWLFLLNSGRVAGGYTEAMMLPGHAPVWSLLGFAALSLGLGLLVARIAWPRLRGCTSILLLGLAGILFIDFKLGYVRHDMHQMNSAMVLLVLTGLLLPLAWQEAKPFKLVAAGLLVSAGIFSATIFHDFPPANELAAQLAATMRLRTVLAPEIAAGTGFLQASNKTEMARIAAKNPLPPLRGGADLYSYYQGVLFAHDLRYQPRPVIQSYSAYTPELAQMNADWLRSTRAADNLLFAVQTIDQRFPSLDDGRSWPEILTRYEVDPQVSLKSQFLLLHRSAVPRSYRFVLITNAVVLLGSELAIPAVSNVLIWVEMDFKKTAGGKIATAAYKPPVLMMKVACREGATEDDRLIPGIARAGFLLSPVIRDNKSFAALFAPDWPAKLTSQEVRSITIQPELPLLPGWGYDPMYEARFYHLELSPP